MTKMIRRTCASLLGVLALLAQPAHAVAVGSYYSYTYVHGTLTDLTADQAGLGLPGNTYALPTVWDERSSAQSWDSTGVVDSTARLLTQDGRYQYSYSGNAQVDANSRLHAKIETHSNDLSHSSPTNLFGNASALWGDSWYVAATADHAAGSLGLLNIHLSLDGNILGDGTSVSARPFNNYVSLMMSRFAASGGGGVRDSIGGVYLNGQNAMKFTSPGGSDWNTWPITASPVGAFSGLGSVEAEVLMPFLYGQSFGVELQLNLLGYGNSTLDFGHTGKITAVEMLVGTTLETGYAAANPGEPPIFTQIQSNNPVLIPVPEPGTGVLLSLGALLLAAAVRRRA
ncbi:PEP-CTERM sorting domain-containing protein [Paucibacter sp. B2R-40]|uniref:PEP-CTERM sorting domain-containing protein n=1 Tax=Paucibacter sp. B2R-40 TaxID=2893554 RepID=UPI0021E44D46|nr:PEP-CTERM sorting domain-containing protein [Paucibacter sp. B2R-40]MCV2357012.1 PEP-CTERM sorting domain-containing protein [Paucibacter sp. B2R-40]